MHPKIAGSFKLHSKLRYVFGKDTNPIFRWPKITKKLLKIRGAQVLRASDPSHKVRWGHGGCRGAEPP